MHKNGSAVSLSVARKEKREHSKYSFIQSFRLQKTLYLKKNIHLRDMEI